MKCGRKPKFLIVTSDHMGKQTNTRCERHKPAYGTSYRLDPADLDKDSGCDAHMGQAEAQVFDKLREYIKKHEISCAESVFQSDRGADDLVLLGELIEIVGYADVEGD